MAKIYFIRVGGTAMGGVAAACARQGDAVFGSEEDLYEPMKSYLADSGVTVFPHFSPANLIDVDPDLVVVGNAVSRGNPELELALDRRMECVSLPEIVARRLIGRRTSIVIAGTHGKTTTTAMTTNLLEHGGFAPGFLIGGVPGNYDVSCRAAGGEVFVIEGDEYDSAYFDKRSKFLHYRPVIAVLNNLEFDHADIFQSLDEIKKSFTLFARLVPRSGLILAHGDDPNLRDVLDQAVSPIERFGFGPENDWVPTLVESGPASTMFELRRRGDFVGTFSSPVPGAMNVLNFTVAVACGYWLGMRGQALADGVASYLPPKRRMEEIGVWNQALVIEDFGHHPTAVRLTLDALRTKYPGRRVIAFFEPRSNTTTRNFYQKELTDCWSGCAAVAIGALDRPHRYADSERLDTARIVRDLGDRGIQAFAISLEQGADPQWGRWVAEWIAPKLEPGDLLVLFSNGDCGGLRQIVRA